MNARRTTPGSELHAFASRLYPICRSITGNGVRQTLAIIRERIPISVREVPTGSAAFDWEVPPEWNIEDAAILSPDGERVVDFQRHNLHIVGYSEPVSATLPLERLQERLHSLPDHPAWIPYRTSYYRRSWGFCLADATRRALRPGNYRVEIKSSLSRGSLTYGELEIPGRSREEVLFFTHVCHPSLANDNTSGIAIATALAEWVASEPRRNSYRFVFAPGTIGSLCWLKQNERRLAGIRAGLVLGLLGDQGRAHLQDEPQRRCRDGLRRALRALADGSFGFGRSVLAVRLRRAAALLARIRSPGRAPHALGQRRLPRVPHLGRRSRAHPAALP